MHTPTHAINGVFSGGGIKGVALAGAAAGAMESGYRFDHAVGTSAGALVASLVASGYRPDELGAAVRWIPWPQLLDWLPVTRVPLLGKALAMTVHKAQCAGDVIETTWTSLLASKGVYTFSDLAPDSLRIVATDLTHQRGVVLPDDLPGYGIDPARFPVARAVRMSSAVPFFLRPVRLRHPETGDVSLMADGALTANFPIRVARRSKIWPVIGFRFLDARDHPHVRVRGPASLARAVVTAGIRAGEVMSLTSRNDAMLVDLRSDRDPLEFAITPDEAAAMFDEGRRRAIRSLTSAPEAPRADAGLFTDTSATREPSGGSWTGLPGALQRWLAERSDEVQRLRASRADAAAPHGEQPADDGAEGDEALS
jgi:NTE family protein